LAKDLEGFAALLLRLAKPSRSAKKWGLQIPWQGFGIANPEEREYWNNYSPGIT